MDLVYIRIVDWRNESRTPAAVLTVLFHIYIFFLGKITIMVIQIQNLCNFILNLHS